MLGAMGTQGQEEGGDVGTGRARGHEVGLT